MIGAAYFQTLADYNKWANDRIFAAAATLSDGDYRRERGAFFGSIHNTLNHILVGDRIWLARIDRIDHGIRALDEILYDDFDRLYEARRTEDARIIDMTRRIDGGMLEDTLEYHTIAGHPMRTAMPMVLAHLFNHATHHRGQVHDLLSQAGAEPPVLDLIYFLR